MTTRSLPTPQRPCWALGGPSYGPGFASTAFRLQSFKQEATSCWADLISAVKEPLEGEVLDLDASDLRPRTVEEELQQKVERLSREIRAKRLGLLPEGEGVAAEQGEGGEGDGAASSAPVAEGQQGDPQRGADQGGASGAAGQGEGAVEGEQPGGEAATAGEASDAATEPEGRGSQPAGRGRGAGRGRKKGEGRKGKKRWLDLPSVPEVKKAAQGRPGSYQNEGLKKKFNKRPQGSDGEKAAMEKQMRHEFEQSKETLTSVRVALAFPVAHVTPFTNKVEGAFRDQMVATGGGAGPRLADDESLLRIEIRDFDSLHLPLQEFLVPGSQKMTVLRDAIRCIADKNMQSLKMDVPGAFFYIEGIFYVDRRGSTRGPTDYVTPIREFCHEHGIHPPPPVQGEPEALPRLVAEDRGFALEEDMGAPYREMDMAQMTWDEVGLRAGPTARNVYCHQGCCEHLLVVRDVRRLHPSDPPHASAYPLVLRKEAHYIRTCEVCTQALAQKVTYDDRNAPQNPAFWCLECYQMMHYDKDNNLLYTHKVFDYACG